MVLGVFRVLWFRVISCAEWENNEIAVLLKDLPPKQLSFHYRVETAFPIETTLSEQIPARELSRPGEYMPWR